MWARSSKNGRAYLRDSAINPAPTSSPHDGDQIAAGLRALIAERYPVYEQADITIQSREVPHEKIVDEIVGALAERLAPDADAPDAVTDGDSVP